MQSPPSFLPDAPFRDRPAGPLLVGFSGGLDSTVLLHALAHDAAPHAAGIRAIHIHHGLQSDADRWAAHCDRICSALRVPLEVARVAVRPQGNGVEAAARDARHAAFAQRLDGDSVLAVAHHRDDQAETFLLRALRGSSVDGLAAMRRWRPLGAGQLWRPLLELPRAALLAYAHQHQLDWIEDPSNADSRFDRNFLRQQVMPLLQMRWANASAAFSRSSTLCAQASDLLVEQDRNDLAAVIDKAPRRLSIPVLLTLPSARRARVLRCWIETLGLPPLPSHGVALIESDLMQARDDASACFRWQGSAIHAWRDGLHAVTIHAAFPNGWQQAWDGRQPLLLPDGGSLTLEGAPHLPENCRVFARRGGERIHLRGRDHRHSLKHLLQQLAVPPWQRLRLPLLETADGRLLAVADLAYDAGFADCLDRNHARLRWSPAPE